jgi:hypothetical protein
MHSIMRACISSKRLPQILEDISDRARKSPWYRAGGEETERDKKLLYKLLTALSQEDIDTIGGIFPLSPEMVLYELFPRDFHSWLTWGELLAELEEYCRDSAKSQVKKKRTAGRKEKEVELPPAKVSSKKIKIEREEDAPPLTPKKWIEEESKKYYIEPAIPDGASAEEKKKLRKRAKERAIEQARIAPYIQPELSAIKKKSSKKKRK